MKLLVYLVLLIGLMTSGCRSTTPKSETNLVKGVPPVAKNAYSLLYQLLKDEKDASKLLLIKRDSRELNGLAREVSTVSSKAFDQLKSFGDQDSALDLDAVHLPPGEVATRKAIAETKIKELLSNSGDAFERSFLLTQVAAMNYAAHLAAETDPDPIRSKWSASIHRQMTELHSRCVGLLARSPHGR